MHRLEKCAMMINEPFIRMINYTFSINDQERDHFYEDIIILFSRTIILIVVE